MFKKPKPTGVASDASGGPIIDPTKNVLDLVAAETKYQDGMRELTSKIVEVELKGIRQEIKNFKAYSHELAEAERKRIDAIRAVDVGAVAVDKAVAETRASTLAKQVTDAAVAQSIALKAETDPIRKDIGDLRQSQYTIAGGKQEVQAKSANWGLWVGIITAVVLGLGTILFNTVMLGVTLYIGLRNP